MYTAPDQIQEQQTASPEPHDCGLIASKLIAGCTKLLTSPGKLNIREHSVGAPFFGRLLRSMNAKRTAEQLFQVPDLAFTVPLQASLHLSVGAFFTCGFSLTFQRSYPEPAVQSSRRLQKLNNSKTPKLGLCYTQKSVGAPFTRRMPPQKVSGL
jgi:hypothetical protein